MSMYRWVAVAFAVGCGGAGPAPTTTPLAHTEPTTAMTTLIRPMLSRATLDDGLRVIVHWQIERNDPDAVATVDVAATVESLVVEVVTPAGLRAELHPTSTSGRQWPYAVAETSSAILALGDTGMRFAWRARGDEISEVHWRDPVDGLLSEPGLYTVRVRGTLWLVKPAIGPDPTQAGAAAGEVVAEASRGGVRFATETVRIHLTQTSSSRLAARAIMKRAEREAERAHGALEGAAGPRLAGDELFVVDREDGSRLARLTGMLGDDAVRWQISLTAGGEARDHAHRTHAFFADGVLAENKTLDARLFADRNPRNYQFDDPWNALWRPVTVAPE